MSKMDSKIVAARGSQLRLILLLFAATLAALFAGYYFFIRTDYSVLFSELGSADASAIVAELDKQGVAYELKDGGATILVPSNTAAQARLAIAGSEIPMKGMVGFELFNESDMGLTDFAQRVNYQRALQGEIARTIMMMDGIESARVHLALPEKSLFRGNRATSKAAVTVAPKRGGTLDEARVLGIQRLVAAAVPDLSLSDVVVLDDLGRVVSAAPTAASYGSPQNEEQAAVQQYYRARARSAVGNVLPGLEFDVRVDLLPRSDGTAAASGAGEGGRANGRDFGIRIMVTTSANLNAEDQALARNAVAGAVELSETAGDSLVFAVAPLAAAVPAAQALALVATPAAPAHEESREARLPWSLDWWTLLAVLAGLAVLVLLYRSRGDGISVEERDLFVGRIRHQLGLAEGRHDA